MSTRRGKPIARLVPINSSVKLTSDQKAALTRTTAPMKKGFDYKEGKFIKRIFMIADRIVIIH